MRNIVIFILLLTVCHNVKGQFIKSTSIKASVGLGITIPNEDYDINGNGVYAQGEYVLEVSKWIDLRPYAGFIYTSKDSDDVEDGELEFDVTSRAFLLGGKIRLTIPIPYVAPYFELGAGASFGSFTTFTPTIFLEKNGVIPHVPITLGLELGKSRKVDLAFVYYLQDSVEQVAGAAAIGISFPLGVSK
ncbi:autotransporter outer membrane beta-barrel domain-containing protein [Dokdonia sinensis]|uniref:Autotransporter outer membrane beta-barrel domain-containing protein n=1 Tax=Dokdonia sinensis TaxID=2479847 RepID=A0A3M0G372_9FLAO|nr:autotransporter outer membrane beta-barrel domain-containing protein [Dokdonia sinensis]RMB59420.1 autotransporter outer membrane beta-barrel domain-containing protein [Dokdonia sinensis]